MAIFNPKIGNSSVLHSTPFIPRLVFSPTDSSKKIRHVIHLRLPSALPRAAVRGAKITPPYRRSSIPIFLLPRLISDFLEPSGGLNLGRPFDLAATLARGSKLESAHEVLDFEFVGIPSI
ncbi:hypothetical protein AVEN_155078-1 [Araneus ventricosus]|uniref:Uncharacterized protein n=1 Tax=Araneus ventricosus TaxID=182803 RepID=A0A4Y2A7I5_ARAVE|nr:hypothetical protein AVEN_155078-1 [Araneus ventricosus]